VTSVKNEHPSFESELPDARQSKKNVALLSSWHGCRIDHVALRLGQVKDVDMVFPEVSVVLPGKGYSLCGLALFVWILS